MNSVFRFLGCLVLVGVVLAAALAVFAYSGAYNMGATSPHSDLVGHALHLTMQRSVRAHARDVAVPQGIDLRDPLLAERALGGYEAMCRTCHGAPGRKPDAWMTGLYPPAPDLTNEKREQQWTNEEVFWVIKNGIKDTGMPALAPTHDDQELWALTALVRQFLTMQPEEYRAMAGRAGVTLAADPDGSHTSENGHRHE